jgi:hypothetical protein
VQIDLPLHLVLFILHAMHASEQTSYLLCRRSARCHAPNINRQEVLTLAQASRLREQIETGMCKSVRSNLALINAQTILVPQLQTTAMPIPQHLYRRIWCMFPWILRKLSQPFLSSSNRHHRTQETPWCLHYPHLLFLPIFLSTAES